MHLDDSQFFFSHHFLGTIYLQIPRIYCTYKAGMMMHTCYPSTEEAEAGESRVQGQPGARLRPCLKKTQKLKLLTYSQ
jgi:hypothetical protein